MTTVLTPTSELEAINTILSVIGESPISSLSEVSSVADAVTAQSILSEVSRQVQTKGWHFNTEKDFELTPDTYNKEILVPTNALRVDSMGDDREMDVVQRGNKLYDRKKHTFQFDKSIKCDLVVLLPFDQLPQAARHYITIKAARIFSDAWITQKTIDEGLTAPTGFTNASLDQVLLAIKVNNEIGGTVGGGGGGTPPPIA